MTINGNSSANLQPKYIEKMYTGLNALDGNDKDDGINLNALATGKDATKYEGLIAKLTEFDKPAYGQEKGDGNINEEEFTAFINSVFTTAGHDTDGNGEIEDDELEAIEGFNSVFEDNTKTIQDFLADIVGKSATDETTPAPADDTPATPATPAPADDTPATSAPADETTATSVAHPKPKTKAQLETEWAQFDKKFKDEKNKDKKLALINTQRGSFTTELNYAQNENDTDKITYLEGKLDELTSREETLSPSEDPKPTAKPNAKPNAKPAAKPNAKPAAKPAAKPVSDDNDDNPDVI